MKTKEQKLETARRWKAANKDKCKESTRKWTAANPEQIRLRYKKQGIKKYGLSWEEYTELYNKQEGKCFICLEFKSMVPDKEEKNPLCIDHCHTTKQVRGLLCSTCNFGLGQFKDDVAKLLRAIKYLT